MREESGAKFSYREATVNRTRGEMHRALTLTLLLALYLGIVVRAGEPVWDHLLYDQTSGTFTGVYKVGGTTSLWKLDNKFKRLSCISNLSTPNPKVVNSRGNNVVFFDTDPDGKSNFFKAGKQQASSPLFSLLGGTLPTFLKLKFFTGDCALYGYLRPSTLYYWPISCNSSDYSMKEIAAVFQKSVPLATRLPKYRFICASSKGIIYATTFKGELHFLKHDISAGTLSSPKVIHTIFGYPFVQCRENGLFGFAHGGKVYTYNDTLQNGANTNDVGWSVGSGAALVTVGTTSYIDAFPKPWAGTPGSTIAFKVNYQSRLTVDYVRLYQKNKNDQTVQSFERTSIPQFNIYPTSYSAGTSDWAGVSWATTFSLVIPSAWNTGVYAAVLTDTGAGITTYVPFVVLPQNPASSTTVPKNPALFVLPIFSYSGYNSWGGRSMYTDPTCNPCSLERPFALSVDPFAPPPVYTLANDMWFFNWLEDKGIKFDVVTDVEFHNGITNLNMYSTLILGKVLLSVKVLI